MNQPPR